MIQAGHVETQPDLRSVTISLDHGASQSNEHAHAALTLISSRQNVSPKRLLEPAPSPSQIELIFQAAAAAPDHGQLMPWRFIVIPNEKRASLAEAFAQALIERDSCANLQQIEQARDKAYRAPLLVLAVASFASEDKGIPQLEQMVSMGCAIQNILLCAQAMQFGSGLTSGQAMKSTQLRGLFSLKPNEQAVCFINIGTVSQAKPMRLRPATSAFLTEL